MAFIQTSLPDAHYLSLGISVDITKAAVENRILVIVQANAKMPRVLGDGFIHASHIDFIIPYDEPVLEYNPEVDDEILQQIGQYVSRLISGWGHLTSGVWPYPQRDLIPSR